MTYRTRLFLAAFGLFLLSIPPSADAQAIVHQISLPSQMTWCDDSMINGLFSDINALRAQNGRPALSISTLGMKDAEIRATQLATYMQTANPGTPGFNPHTGYDTTAASLGYDLISENLAYYTSSQDYIVYSVWQDSLHLAAMLSTAANVAGVSCVYESGTPYWTYEPGYCTGTSCSTPVTTPTPTPSGTPTLDSEEWAFLTLINNYRAQNGVGPLQADVDLENSSRWMSNDMASKNYFSHTDSLGRDAGTRIASFGYTYYPWGENLAAGASDAQGAFNLWVNACDPDASGACTYAHRQNMLGAGFKAIGIARAYGSSSSYGWYWTTDFGGVVEQAITPPTGTPSSQPPAITSFTASPTSITAGQSATLSWNVTGATSVTLSNGIGTVAASGSLSVSPSLTTTYSLTATNSAGSTSAAATVTVTAAKDTTPPTTPVLTAAVARSATEVDLSWTASSDNVAVAGYQILRNGAVLTSGALATLSYADTSVQAGTTYTYMVKAYDAAGNYSAASNSVQATTPTVTPPPSTFTPISINAGAGAVTDNTGRTWAADNSYSGGLTWATTSPIANTANPALYQTCRYGNFSYTLPVPNGNYTVTLKFAEPSRFAAGLRQFNVAINNNTVLNNFDIFAQAGGANVAIDKVFPVSISGGSINIQFSQGAADLPLINAIAVDAGSTPTPTPTPGSSTVRVNSGGPAYTDPSGHAWAADTSFSGGATWITSANIANTATPTLYQTCRYGNFTYSFAVPNGNYSVTLKFAEPTRFAVGYRVFNVGINGSPVLTNFDIYAQAGGANIAIDKSFPVSVSGGTINIQFTQGPADLPLVSAIDIEPASTPTPTPTPSGGSTVRVDSGGAAYTDPGGHAWVADNSYSGGTPLSTSATITNTGAPVLYQTARSGNFSYNFPVPNGNYNVTLKFAEISKTGPGQRAFSVIINGGYVLANFDIFARAGGANSAIDVLVPVTVTGGQIAIQFLQGTADLPLINAVDIEPAAP